MWRRDPVRLRGQEPDGGAEHGLECILDRAVEFGASDVHLQPIAGGVRVRYRVDGELRDGWVIAERAWPPLLGRLKLLAGLDLLDGLRPQDGVLSYRGRNWRLALLSSVQGERVTLRFQADLPSRGLEGLGLEAEVVAGLRFLLEGTGLLAITGPASSGKTTTLYTCLTELVAAGKSAVSVEDPVEHFLPGVTQVQVRARAGFGFLTAMKAALRHDPQVLAVGEVRDEESTRAVVRTALGGHLVLCTLHAGGAEAALERLVEMGASRRQLASALCGILEQRLVRKACSRCRGTGGDCPNCGGRGWQGRRALARLVPTSPGIRKALVGRPPFREGGDAGYEEG